MSYLTLSEAATYASRVKGFAVEPATLLRAGIHGQLLIAATFNGLMRNLTAHTNDEYVGLLILAPSELMTIETEGQARITGAFGLDRKAAYSPQVIRTLAQLRVVMAHLDQFLPLLTSTETNSPAGNCPWWQTDYKILDIAQTIGAKLQDQKKRTSNKSIAIEIEKRINDIERSSARDRRSPNWDTIRGVLTGWQYKNRD